MNRKEILYGFMTRRLDFLQNGSPASRAELAKLRRGAGTVMAESPETWAVVLTDLPTELCGDDMPDGFEPSYAENAVHVALTLFAWHMQGRESAYVPGIPFARACRIMAEQSNVNTSSVKVRVDSMISSESLEELSAHAKGLITLMRNTHAVRGFDYSKFAVDLYFIQFEGGMERTLIQWGQDFYSVLPAEKLEASV